MNQIPLVVLSCDKYADLWEGFFYQWKKCVDIPFVAYLITNRMNFDSQSDLRIQVINTGDDPDWSTSLSFGLKQIQEDKIFLILEDLFISETVDAQAFLDMLEFCQRHDAQHIKYFANPLGEIKVGRFLKYPKGMPYLVSACGLWDRKYLLSLLIPGESPWDFEVNASYRARYSADRFYSPLKPLIKYKNMVEKGAWIKSSLQWALDSGTPVRNNVRPIRNNSFFHLKRFYFELVMQCPWRLRVGISSFFKKLLASY